MKAFTLAYTLFALLLYAVALPLIILYTFKHKYRESIPARFFLWKNRAFAPDGVWFHACSLGEVRALKPLIDALGDTPLRISTITHTGYGEAKKYDAQVRYLPYELFLPFWLRRQKVLIVLEAEFWYLLFAVAAFRGCSVILLNARISERSFPKYMKLRWFYSRLLAYADTIYCQSSEDKARFEALGAKNIEVTGNIKLAQKIEKTKVFEKPEGEVIVAASTHEGEEAVILDAFVSYRNENTSKLIVVPRHPERFESVWKLMEVTAETEELTLSRWSEVHNFSSDMILIDAMGELNNIYAISDIAVLGGAFKSDVGGHNPLEPAHFGCKIITGKHHFLQRELFKYVKNVQVVESEAIESALINAQTLAPSTVDETIDLERVITTIKKEVNQ